MIMASPYNDPPLDVIVSLKCYRAGSKIGSAEAGLLATVGASHVVVHPTPRVAVLSTGGMYSFSWLCP